MRIHFIGIGGIGMSSLAQYYLKKGHKVSGSDLAPSEITDFLQKKGVKILFGNEGGHIQEGLDLVVYSPAVQPENPEYKKAKELRIKLQSYPQALGELTRQHYTIAISGSHGKSTTTAMTALAMIKAKLDPTVIVGTKLKEFGNSNFRMGKSKYLVIEACEYDDSFLNYIPQIAVITNIDKEHLDYFKTFENVVQEFNNFILKLPKGGSLVKNKDDAKSAGLKTSGMDFNIVEYSKRQRKDYAKLKKIMKIPGEHNISNALAVLAVARILGIKDSVTFKSLGEYQGSWRRFEVKSAELRGKLRGTTRKITIISDYGHHPNEVMATLQSAREKYPKKTLWLIFQPHQYQRTHYLFDDFVKVFRKAPMDKIIITDIYDVAGREEKNISAHVNSKNLVKKIARKHIAYMALGAAETFVKENIEDGDVLIIMGAGDIYKLVERF